MTLDEQKKIDNSQFSFIRDRLTPSLLLALIGLMITAIVMLRTVTFSSVEMKVNTENRTKTSQNFPLMDSVSSHIKNEELHKPYSVMNELWVPRFEIDSMNIETQKYLNELTAQVATANAQVLKTNRMIREFLDEEKRHLHNYKK